jgi:hypothetical protein
MILASPHGVARVAAAVGGRFRLARPDTSSWTLQLVGASANVAEIGALGIAHVIGASWIQSNDLGIQMCVSLNGSRAPWIRACMKVNRRLNIEAVV